MRSRIVRILPTGLSSVNGGTFGGGGGGGVPILFYDAFQKQLGLLTESLPYIVIEVGELSAIRTRICQVAEIQPLASEIGHQRLRASVGQHAAHLPFQYRRLVQFALSRQIEQFVVGNAAPQEKG